MLIANKMKHFVVFVGVLALLAFSQAQSEESENVTAPEDNGEDSSPAPPPPGPPGRPGHSEKPRPPAPEEKPQKPKLGLHRESDGWSFNAPGISIHIGRLGRGQSEQKPQPAESDETAGRPSRRRPLRFPVFLDSNVHDNRVEGGVNNS